MVAPQQAPWGKSGHGKDECAAPIISLNSNAGRVYRTCRLYATTY
jgi:hypothetical protein